MSINVYLRGEWVTGLMGFETTKCRDSKSSNTWDDNRLPGIRLSHEHGRWYITLERTDRIPSILLNIVEEVTSQEWVSFVPHKRERGVYRLGSAEAEVGAQSLDDGRMWVCIVSKTMEDLRELDRQIRVGSILPVPELSYEGKQGGLSRAELEAKVAELEAARVSLHKLCAELRETSNSRWTRLAEFEEERDRLVAEHAELEIPRAKSEEMASELKWELRFARWLTGLIDSAIGTMRVFRNKLRW